MVSAVNAFKAKLALWKLHMENNNLSYFPNLRMVIESLCDEDVTTHQFVKHFDSLLTEFNKRFEEFSELETFLIFFINPYSHRNEGVKRFQHIFSISNKEDLELEIINITNDIQLKSYCNEENFWNLVDINIYPLLEKMYPKVKFPLCLDIRL
uniref:General transcription factor II-I repeat domain-containing protein 2B-like n=1 Tax=Diabrotica virgifera virgifera TaxID=50390 RepID=A0A6P7GZ54_DIAVI